jgi:hypothetical protein
METVRPQTTRATVLFAQTSQNVFAGQHAGLLIMLLHVTGASLGQSPPGRPNGHPPRNVCRPKICGTSCARRSKAIVGAYRAERSRHDNEENRSEEAMVTKALVERDINPTFRRNSQRSKREIKEGKKEKQELNVMLSRLNCASMSRPIYTILKFLSAANPKMEANQ